MLEPHLPAVPIQLPTQYALLEPRQKLVVQHRNLQVNKLVAHDAEVLGRPAIEDVGEAVLDELADDGAHLLCRVLDRCIVLGRGERLLELGDRIVRRDGGALALAEERVDVEAGEGLDGFLSAAPALGLGRDWLIVLVGFTPLLLANVPFLTSAASISTSMSGIALFKIFLGGFENWSKMSAGGPMGLSGSTARARMAWLIR